MICATCPVPLPLVTVETAGRILGLIDKDAYPKLVLLGSQWLLGEHPGISFYEHITGRLHTNEERARVADDTAMASQIPCPYACGGEPYAVFSRDEAFNHVPTLVGVNGLGCVIEALNPRIRIVRTPGKRSYMWLPAALMMLADHALYQKLVKQNRVADVLYAVLSRDEAFYR